MFHGRILSDRFIPGRRYEQVVSAGNPDGDGETTVELPAAAFVELRSAEQDVEVISGNATFHIRTLRSHDFPTFPERWEDRSQPRMLPVRPASGHQ